ncbi:signal recognition particle subunit SRP68 [Planococcus citri]|uniref:signal recognition particle subunit SRP68 n=1 Tax=Planococcus citri TaxID=170843 RepID=UPI0031F90744
MVVEDVEMTNAYDANDSGDVEMSSADSKTKRKSKKSDNSVVEPLCTIRILRIVKDVQQQHGLRHSDYQRYRGYCSRRIRRLRKALSLPPSDRHNFKKKTFIDEGHLNDKTITIPLMLAERAWSYAMQLRLEANTEPRKKFHLISRLRKATTYALQLQQLCDSPKFDSRTKLEAEGYVAWIHGTLHFELQLWKSAIEYFKKAQLIYEKLASALNEEDATLYRQKSEEITPSLRYCAYNLGEATAAELLQLRSQAHGELLKNLDILVDQTVKYNTDAMNEVKWRNRSFPVKSEKVRAFLMADRDLEKSFVNASIVDNLNLIEQHLMDCKDAITVVKDECKADPGVKSADGLSSTQLLLHYLSYIRLNRTIKRNHLLIEVARKDAESSWTAEESKKLENSSIQRTKYQDRTRLYEIIIQNLMEMEQLPICEYDTDFAFEIQSKIKAYQALRCYSIGENLSTVGRWGDTVKLYERSVQLATTALKCNSIETAVADELNRLIEAVESNRMIVQAKSMFAPESSEKKDPKKPPLIDRLDEYFEDPSLVTKQPNLVTVPPSMIPTPCKPLFFDLALDMVKFPSLNEKISGRKGNAANPAGIKGFVKGLWGWNNPK